MLPASKTECEKGKNFFPSFGSWIWSARPCNMRKNMLDCWCDRSMTPIGSWIIFVLHSWDGGGECDREPISGQESRVPLFFLLLPRRRNWHTEREEKGFLWQQRREDHAGRGPPPLIGRGRGGGGATGCAGPEIDFQSRFLISLFSFVKEKTFTKPAYCF